MSQTSWTIKHYDRLTSTQDKVKELVKGGLDSGYLAVVADMQDSGRGRHGNHWVSELGNLYTTLHLKIENLTADKAGHFAFIVAVALTRAIRNFVDVNPQAKWPNDILIEGQKIAGILLETDRS